MIDVPSVCAHLVMLGYDLGRRGRRKAMRQLCSGLRLVVVVIVVVISSTHASLSCCMSRSFPSISLGLCCIAVGTRSRDLHLQKASMT